MEELDIALIAKRSVHGVLALISRKYVLQLISHGEFIIISSIILPKDIGIYTAVIAIQRIINFFTDFGLGAALVQKKESLTQDDITTSFTLQSSITLCVFLIVFFSQKIIAPYFRLDTSGIHLLLSLVFCIFLSSFKTIPSILLERTINFGKLILPQIIESFAFNTILIILVLTHHGIDSYTFAFLLSSLIGIPFYYYISPWNIRLGISKKSLHHLKFGAQFQAKNILATIKDDLLTVILVKFLSFTQIGYIGFAQKLAFFVFRYIVDSVTKVTFSTYSRIQIHTQHLRYAIEKSLFFVSATMFPFLFGIIIVIPYVVHYFPKWNNKWEPALFSLTFFCFNAIISSLSNVLVNFLDATGRVKITLQLMILWTVATWILTPLLIYFYGYNGVSVASFLVTLTIILTVFLVKKVVKFRFLKSIYKPLCASIIMSIITFFGAKIIVFNLISIIFVILLGAGVYSSLLYVFAGKDLQSDFKKMFLNI
jgi:O-antigen/teichoic acid export membrane protein